MIKSVYNRWFGPSFQEMLDAAIKEAAKLRGELEESRTRANYYTATVNKIDPWDDHQSFAAARDKQLEAQREYIALEHKVEHAMRQAEQLIAELTKKGDHPQ